MPDIMDKRCRQQWRTTTIEVFVVVPRFDVLQGLLHQVQHAETVRQAVVVGTGVCDVAHAQLMNPPQSLNFRAIEQVNQPAVTLAVDADIVVERISEDLGRHARSRFFLPISSDDHPACQRLGTTHRLCRLEGARLLYRSWPIKPQAAKKDDG
jgi:hypothetical protein